LKESARILRLYMAGWQARCGGRIRLAAGFVLLIPIVAAAQPIVSDPIVVDGGRLTIGGDISATASCTHAYGGHADCGDDTGFFNYTDYEHSALRMMRFDVTAAWRPNRRVSFLGEVRSENIERPEPYALYVRIRPWVSRRIDIQAGRVPPTFGAFAR